MSPEEAEALQAAYHEERRDWAAEFGRPFPQRRTAKRRPEPGALPLADAEEG